MARRACLALATLEWIKMGLPRKRKVTPAMKEVAWPENESLGSYAVPVEDWIAMVTHLGTLARIPEHSSQVPSLIKQGVFLCKLQLVLHPAPYSSQDGLNSLQLALLVFFL